MTVLRMLGAAIILMALTLTLTMARFERLAPPSSPIDGSPAAFAVLTGGGGARLEAAGALMKAHREAHLLVSGVDGASEGDLGRLLSLDRAEIAARVEAGRTARDTRGNAREVAAWAEKRGWREVVVVTSDYHMARALLEIRRVAPQLRLRAHAVSVDGARLADWWRDPRAFRRVAPESLKYLAAWARDALGGDGADEKETP